METYNNLYVTHHVIHANLTRVFKKKQFDLNDVMEWCQKMLHNSAKDVETMTTFLNVALEVPQSGALKNMVYVPCNVFRLLSVYNGSTPITDYLFDGSYIKLPLDSAYSYIVIDYKGTPINEDGIPLIPKQYQEACETYCKVQAFEEDVTLGLISAQMWAMWDQKWPGQIGFGKQDWRFKDIQQIDMLNIIHGNLLPTIAGAPIYSQFYQ